jgi:hypothetical protein
MKYFWLVLLMLFFIGCGQADRTITTVKYTTEGKVSLCKK